MSQLFPGAVVEAFYDEGLGNSSYLVASGDERTAVVIDPQRDVERYLALAEERGWRITHTLETHLHADFVSGSRELAARTGATVVASHKAGLGYPHRGVRDQDLLDAGGLRFRVLVTPGHTSEHVCFVALDKTGEPAALFSGGTLLPGSAARTDLVGPGLTAALTRALHHSLHHRLRILPDELPVYPTHGAGSICATGTRGDRETTMGHERRTNPLLTAPTEEAFKALALRDLPPYPDYFLRMRRLNQAGPPILGGLPQPPPLSPQTVSDRLASSALLLDTRPPEAFDTAHIPGSFGIPLSAGFGSWVGWVVPSEPALIFIAESEGELADAVRPLVRIGYERFDGYLAGGIDAWRSAGYSTIAIERVAPTAAAADGQTVLDVREPAEWRDAHIPGALSAPLTGLRDALPRLPRRPLLVHCAHEFRSTVANSLLERGGFTVRHLAGGFEAWRESGQPIAPATPG